MPSTSKSEKKSKKSEKEEEKVEKKKNKTSKASKTSKSTKASKTKKRGPGRPPKSETKSSSQKKKTTSKEKKESTKSKSVKPKSKAKSVIVDVIKDDDDVEFYRSSAEDVFDKSEEDVEPEVLANRAQDLPIDGENKDDYVTEKSEFHLSEGEIDNQKKYYRELSLEIERSKEKKQEEDIPEEEVEEILEEEFDDSDKVKASKKKTGTKNKNKDQRRLGLYTRFVWRFLAVVAVLVFLVFFLSFSSLKINLIPETENLNDNTLIKVVTAESERQASFIDPREEINGVIEELELNFEKEFSSSGEEYVGEEIVGRVKLINEYSRAQPLVRETRLHSPEGKEFKIKEAVNIPSGGEVWVDIYAENPTRDLAIESTTFTIPGLWAGLQESIYAESEEAFNYKQKKKKYIRTSDIAKAKNESESEYNLKLEQKIEQRKNELENRVGKEMAAVYLNDYIKTSTEAESDEELESFKMSVEGSARVAFFNKEDLKKIALGKLNLLIPDGKELINFNEDDIKLIFQSYNSDSKTAQIKANFTGEMILKNNENPINKENLVDLKEPQIEAFLNSKEEIKDYELIFKPGFIKKAPRLVDKIEINVVKD